MHMHRALHLTLVLAKSLSVLPHPSDTVYMITIWPRKTERRRKKNTWHFYLSNFQLPNLIFIQVNFGLQILPDIFTSLNGASRIAEFLLCLLQFVIQPLVFSANSHITKANTYIHVINHNGKCLLFAIILKTVLDLFWINCRLLHLALNNNNNKKKQLFSKKYIS